MGNGILNAYKKYVKKSWKIAFLSVVIIGFLVHLYKFTNFFPGRDSLYNLYADQNVVGSGRWFLSIACGIGSYFDLPMVNGVLSIAYIALTMIVITELFHMENPVLIALSGGILVTFPGITETFLYEYTADGYLLAMLLSAAAVYLTRLREHIGWKNYLLSGICLCLSCAIYQSYVSFALVLLLCHFMYELLENRTEQKVCILWIFRQILLYVLSLVVYYVIWQICMRVQNVGVNDYQGISNLGKDLLGTFLNGFSLSIKSVVLFFLHWNIFRYGLTTYAGLNLVFLVFFGSIVIFAPIRAGIWKQKWQLFLYVLCWLLFIPCCCMWAFTSRDILYRPMMLLALAVPYIFTLVLFERWAKPSWADFAAVLLTVIIFHFGLMANISYHYLFESYEQSYALGLQLMMDIEEIQDDYEFDTIAVIGDNREHESLDIYDEENNKQLPAAGIGVISRYMYGNLLYEHCAVTTMLTDILGMDLKAVPLVEVFLMGEDPEIQQMPAWPEEGCMKVEDNLLILKLYNNY